MPDYLCRCRWPTLNTDDLRHVKHQRLAKCGTGFLRYSTAISVPEQFTSWLLAGLGHFMRRNRPGWDAKAAFIFFGGPTGVNVNPTRASHSLAGCPRSPHLCLSHAPPSLTSPVAGNSGIRSRFFGLHHESLGRRRHQQYAAAGITKRMTGWNNTSSTS